MMHTSLQTRLVNGEGVATQLLAGRVGVMPTDTVYGLVARATDEQAVGRLYMLKSRERKPGTIVAASVKQLKELGVEEALLKQVEQLWPNPLSIILPLPVSRRYLDQGLGDIAMRIPDDAQLRLFLDKTGPLLTSSANLPAQPTSENVQQAWNYFGPAVDFYVNGGALHGRLSSTVARLLDDGRLQILREGALSAADLADIL